MNKLIISLDKLYDLNIAQYSFVLFTYLNRPEDAYRITGISENDVESLVEKKYLDSSRNLTEKGLKIITDSGVREIFQPTSSIDTFIEKYRALFPAGQNSQGYPFRGDKQGCIKKMRKFMKMYPKFTEDIILRATRNYIQGFFMKDPTYMQLAHYLIEKEGISNLAGLCESILLKQNNPQKPQSGGFELDLN